MLTLASTIIQLRNFCCVTNICVNSTLAFAYLVCLVQKNVIVNHMVKGLGQEDTTEVSVRVEVGPRVMLNKRVVTTLNPGYMFS